MVEYNARRPHGGIQYMTPLEKLAERRQALKTAIIDARFEPLRLKFLVEPPKKLTKQERQQLSIESKLQELRKRLIAA